MDKNPDSAPAPETPPNQEEPRSSAADQQETPEKEAPAPTTTESKPTSNILQSKLVLVVLAIAVVVIGAVLVMATMKKDTGEYMMEKPYDTNVPAEEGTMMEKEGGTDSMELNSSQAPDVIFDSYTLSDNLPSLPDDISIYTFKTTHTMEEILSLGAAFNVQEVKHEDKFIVLANTEDPETAGLLVADTTTGAINYQSANPNGIEATGVTSTEKAFNFLVEHDIVDEETVSCPVTYRKYTKPGVTFIECHRDWEKAGLPILNFVGTLNTPSTVRLEDLTPGISRIDIPDVRIHKVSTGDDGFRRPDEFNTATVGVSDSGNIVSVVSNIRKIARSQSVPANELVTPEESLAALEDNTSKYALVIPDGAGLPDMDSIIPQNVAHGDSAVVNDYILAYIEHIGVQPQVAMNPVYIVRGTAELKTGYTVQFSKVIPALKSELSALSLGGEVASAIAAAGDVATPEENTIQMGTFKPVPTIAIEDLKKYFPEGFPSGFADLLDLNTTNGEPLEDGEFDLDNLPDGGVALDNELMSFLSGGCPTLESMSKIYDIGDMGAIGLASFSELADDIQAVHYYHIPEILMGSSTGSTTDVSGASVECGSAGCPNTTRPPIEEVLAELEKVAEKEYIVREEMKFSMAEWDSESSSSCPIRITGGSPTVFVYGDIGSTYTITPGSQLTFTNTATSDSAWDVTIEEEGLSVNNYARDYIYYEYVPVEFATPSTGWNVSKTMLEPLARGTIGPELGLTLEEIERLVFELRTAASNVDSKILFVGPIAQEEVDAKLPLTTAPTIDTVRIHFKVTSGDTTVPTPAVLSPIDRTNPMLLEIGATSF